MEVRILQDHQAVCCIVAAAEATPKAATATKARPAAAIPPRDEQVIIQLDLDGWVACQVTLDLSVHKNKMALNQHRFKDKHGWRANGARHNAAGARLLSMPECGQLEDGCCVCRHTHTRLLCTATYRPCRTAAPDTPV